MYYYQFNIGDYQSHTAHLTEMEDLAYRRLLDWYYLHERPVPLDIGEISRQIRMRSHTDCIAVVLQEYFDRIEDGWIHHRADQEIAKAGERSVKASESAKARWSKEKKDKNANALRSQSEPNAPNTHNTLHKTQDTSVGAVAPAKKASRMTEDWQLPKAWGEWAVAEHNLSADTVRLEASKFRDYWLAKAGKDGAKLDWSATWRNWVRNSLDFSPAAKPGYQTQGDRNQDVLQGLTRGFVGGGNVKLLGS